jgi:hypothetical protein
MPSPSSATIGRARAGAGAVLAARLRQHLAHVARQGLEGQADAREDRAEGLVGGHGDRVTGGLQGFSQTRVRRHIAHRAGRHDQHPHPTIIARIAYASAVI